MRPLCVPTACQSHQRAPGSSLAAVRADSPAQASRCAHARSHIDFRLLQLLMRQKTSVATLLSAVCKMLLSNSWDRVSGPICNYSPGVIGSSDASTHLLSAADCRRIAAVLFQVA